MYDMLGQSAAGKYCPLKRHESIETSIT